MVRYSLKLYNASSTRNDYGLNIYNKCNSWFDFLVHSRLFHPEHTPPSGIALELNDVKMKGEMTFHMVISYKKLPDDRDGGAWCFADILHDLAIKAVTS